MKIARRENPIHALKDRVRLSPTNMASRSVLVACACISTACALFPAVCIYVCLLELRCGRVRFDLLTIFCLQSIVGSTPVDFSVSEFGDAAFTIPIPIPPASRGFGPQLAVDWSSSSSTLGFSVGAGAQVALPIITRR